MEKRRESILLLEDEPQARAAITGLLEAFIDVVGVGTVASAREMVGTRRWGGIVVDVRLPDGNGLDWLAEVRERPSEKGIPALVLSAHCSRELINRAFALGASYLCKPFAPADLITFARRTGTTGGLGSALTHAVTDLAARHRLSAKEVEVVNAAVRGVSRKVFISSRGISMNTYKSQVRSALRKMRASSLGEVRDAVLRAMTD